MLTRASIVVALLLVPLPLAGQSAGRISGRAIDETGSPLPGATITATGADDARRSLTDAEGKFAIADLPPGLYTVAATLEGFRSERRRIAVRAGETSVIDFNLRVGCLGDTITIVDHHPVVEPGLIAHSDLVAYVRLEERIYQESDSDPECRIPYRATIFQSATRPGYRGKASGTIDVFLKSYPRVQAGNEYMIWLTWRSDKNAFDGRPGTDELRPVRQGSVTINGGPCVDIPNPPPNYCRQTYSVDELLTIYQDAFTAQSP